MKKRIFTLILTVIMLVSTVSFHALSDTVFEGGDGSEQNPYLISTPYQLDCVRNDLTAHYKLINDVVFDSETFKYQQYFDGGFKAIGTYDDCFSGTFDGNGFAIKNIQLYQTSADNSILMGIFGCNLGTIKNLTLSDSTLDIKTEQYQSTTYMRIGLIAAVNAGTILNCTNNVNVMFDDFDSFYDLFIGGIAGLSTSTVKDCTNNARINSDTEQRGSTYVGGITGRSDFVDNCTNNGEITMSVGYNGGGETITAAAGGISGDIVKNMKSCTNNGRVNTYISRSRATGYIGGIVGKKGSTNALIDIESCINNGHVNVQYNYTKVTYPNFYAGGIAGHATNINITDCESHGGVTLDKGDDTNATTTYAGGIAGYVSGGKITNCKSSFGVYTRALNIAYAGGIAGYSESEISDCTHSGSSIITYSPVTAYAGGIVGYSLEGVTRCSNNSKITVHSNKNTSQMYAGGILGYCNSGSISECYNAGDIFAKESSNTVRIGGILGYTPTNSVSIVNCFNAANGSSTESYSCYMGGITGENGIITNVYTAGTLDAAATNLSAYYISGSANKYNITNAYFIGEQGDNFGVGCSAEQFKNASTFTGFDFENVWKYDTSCNYLYPQLLNKPIIDEVTAIDVTPPSNVNYYKGSDTPLDLTGGTVTVTYKFAGQSVLPLTEQMVSGFTTEEIQTVWITVTIGRFTDTFAVFVTCDHDYNAKGDYHGHRLECSKCDDKSTLMEHEYAYDCSSECSVCGYTRTAYHSTQQYKDDKKHWTTCYTCNQTISSGAHVYDNDCDASCDECWYFRDTGHIYDNDCDKECNRCGSTRITSHNYVANCSSKCSVCGNKNPNQWDHTLEIPCISSQCLSCLETVSPTEEHAYNYECSETCRRCNTARKTTHNYGEYTYNNDATTEADGTRSHVCLTCFKHETVVAPDTRILKDTSEYFVDIPQKAWYKKHIDYAVTYNIFSGTSATDFSPSTNMTRAQFVQVFANLSGVDTSNRNVDSGFTDVPRKKWYTGAVKWAADNGIVSGMGNGTFQPNADVTREQMCVMLVGYVESFQKSNLKTISDAPDFADHASISKWARKSVYKCADAQLVSGVGGNHFDPKASATRAQGATIFSNFYKQYIKKY